MGIFRRCVSAFFVLAVTVVVVGQYNDPAAKKKGANDPALKDQGITDPALIGAIDLHSHQDPDTLGSHNVPGPRAYDAIDTVTIAKSRGMRGMVLKYHFDQSAGYAFLMRRMMPDLGLDVFGSIALNIPAGGINPQAVINMANVKGGWGRVVWMPTLDAEYRHERLNPGKPFVSVSHNGELLPAVKQIISIIATTRTRDSNGELVLATGHSSPEESLMMIREGKRQGVKHMVATHPSGVMTIAQMKEAASLGAFIEFTANFAAYDDAANQTPKVVDAIREIGAQYCYISSDSGRLGVPRVTDGLAIAAKALRSHGITEQELNLMFKENPARILGLSLDWRR
jgi:hypothetical protein